MIMDKKAEYNRIYKESFNDSADFLKLYFNKVYDDKQAMMLDIDGVVVSGLLLRHFRMNFNGSELPMGYICGAATSRRMRSHGYMSELIQETIRRSYKDGDFMLALIPSDNALYNYYSKFGFSPVFYVQEERYTSDHNFGSSDGDYSFGLSPDNPEVSRMFLSLSSLRGNSVLITPEEYEIIVEDNRLDGGVIIAAYNRVTASVEAVAVAVVKDGEIIVRDILSVSNAARNAALGEVQRRLGKLPVTVITPVDDGRNAPLHVHGMGRIINTELALNAVAQSNRSLSVVIRVRDRLLPQNNHIYVVDNGSVTINDGFGGKIDLDLTQAVLTTLIFSAPDIGKIFNLPTSRPFISLMLE